MTEQEVQEAAFAAVKLCATRNETAISEALLHVLAGRDEARKALAESDERAADLGDQLRNARIVRDNAVAVERTRVAVAIAGAIDEEANAWRIGQQTVEARHVRKSLLGFAAYVRAHNWTTLASGKAGA